MHGSRNSAANCMVETLGFVVVEDTAINESILAGNLINVHASD